MPKMNASSPQTQRELFLRKLYDLTDGQNLKQADIRQVGAEVGLDEMQSLRVANYLANEGLLKNVTVGTVALSHDGIKFLDKIGFPDPHNMSIRRNQRLRLLKYIGEAEMGTNPYVGIRDLQNAFPWSKLEVHRALDYLLEEGLVVAKHGSVEITHKGVKDLESQFITNPGSSHRKEPSTSPEIDVTAKPDSTPPQSGGVSVSGGNVSARDVVGGDVIYNNYGERESADHREEQTLQTYLDKITELIDRNFLNSPPNSQLRVLARTRTLTALKNLNHARQLELLRFLRELSRSNADGGFLFPLTDAPVIGLVPRADFYDTYLTGFNLPFKSDLDSALFGKADLSGVDFSNANLASVVFESAILRAANLSHANLQNANFGGAFLGGAILRQCNLANASFHETYMIGVRELTPQQLSLVKTLNHAVMPDGRVWQGNPAGPYTIPDLAPYFPKA